MKPPCRISLVFAREAAVAVVLRRGPSKLVKVLKWSTGDDEIEDGQWLRGGIYEERCDLSPDGKLFVYFARSERQVEREDGTLLCVMLTGYSVSVEGERQQRLVAAELKQAGATVATEFPRNWWVFN